MNKFLAISYITIVLLCSCKENSTSGVILNPKIREFYAFPINEKCNVSLLKSAMHGEPDAIVYTDTALIFSFFYPKQDLVGAYLLRSGEYYSIIRTGRGPSEGVSAAGIGINRNLNTFWFYDDLQRNISFTPLKSMFDSTQKKINKELIPIENFWNIEMFTDSIFLAFSSEQFPEKKITMLNPYTHEVINRVGDFYKTNGCPIEGVSTVFFGIVKSKPGGGQFVCAYHRTDVVEIYNENGVITSSVQGPDCFNAEYKIDEVSPEMGVRFHPVGEERIAYTALSTTKKYIYGLYDYRYVHIFDWNGKPIKRITLGSDIDEQAEAFCVDSQDSLLFYYSEANGRFCKIELNINRSDDNTNNLHSKI